MIDMGDAECFNAWFDFAADGTWIEFRDYLKTSYQGKCCEVCPLGLTKDNTECSEKWPAPSDGHFATFDLTPDEWKRIQENQAQNPELYDWATWVKKSTRTWEYYDRVVDATEYGRPCSEFRDRVKRRMKTVYPGLTTEQETE